MTVFDSSVLSPSAAPETDIIVKYSDMIETVSFLEAKAISLILTPGFIRTVFLYPRP